MLPRAPLAALAALISLLVPAAGAQAALDLTHVSADVREVTEVDGVVGPGDQILIDETFSSATAISGAQGQLFTPDGEVEVGQAAFPDAAADAPTQSETPFRVLLPSLGVDCGQNLAFTMAVQSAGDSGDVPFSVPTGTPGPWTSQGAGTSAEIAGDGTPTFVQLDLPDAAGRIKDLRVRIGGLSHPRVSDLELALIAPDGRQVRLLTRRGGTGANLVNTVFTAESATPVADAAAPFTGPFRPEESLDELEGQPIEGSWQLRITDTDATPTSTGAPSSGSVNAWSLETRRAHCAGIPRARVTADPTQVAPGGTVAFDASASFDPDGSIKAYEFDLDGNGTYEIGPTTDPTHAIAYPAAEGKRTVPVGVRVTDSQDLQDTVVLMVPVTVAPQAQISPSSATPLSQTFVTFDAGASTDPDGTIVRYQWDLDGSGSFETDTQRSATASKAYAKPGPVTVKVLVTDDNGATAVEQTTITVANRPPVAALTAPSPVVAGRAHTFSAATSVDPDGKIKRYDWDLDLDGRYETTTGTSPTYTRTFAAGGAAAIAVQVTDEQNVVDAKRLDFQVRHAPAVDLAASANPVSLRRSTTLSAAVTDADSPLDGMTYAWDLDADGQFDDAAGPGPHPVTFATAGTRRLGVRVTDSDLATTTRTLDVVVRNAAPVARVTGPDAVQRGQSLTLDASASSDPDGAVVAYAWDLDGDGRFERQTGATPTTSTAFANAGYLQPRVQVTDDDGATQVAGVQVHVTDPPPPAPEPQPEPQPGDGGTGGTDTGGTDTGAQPPAGGSGSTPAPPADPPAPVGGTPPGGDPGTQGGPVAPARPRAVLSGAAIQRVTSVLRRGVSLTCTAVAEGRCELELFVSRTDARRLRLKKPSARTRVGRASVVLEGGKAQRVAVRLSPAVRRGLRRAGRIRLLARGFAVNGAGERVVLQRVVLVRR